MSKLIVRAGDKISISRKSDTGVNTYGEVAEYTEVNVKIVSLDGRKLETLFDGDDIEIVVE